MKTLRTNSSLRLRCASVATAIAFAALLTPSPASAQPAARSASAPKPAATSPQDMEPAVDTSARTAPAAASSAPAPTTTPARTGGAKAASPGAPSSGQPRRPAAGKALDRLDLESTQITGNRELPKVLYIVPWKRPELGDLLGKPANSLLDEVLAPVDRDVFRRETSYYEALAAGSRDARDEK